MSLLYVALLVGVSLALCYLGFTYCKVKRLPEGNENMQEMAGIIRSGAKTFMRAEYKVIIIAVLALAVFFTLFVEKFAGITFIFGACMSSAVCILGMNCATYANVRTTNRALETKNIGKTLQVAFAGGSVSGIGVPAFGIFGLVLVLIIFGEVDPFAEAVGLIGGLKCNPTIMHITTYSLGCSVVAMFNRVGGGNYTKAADISSDILAKNRHDLPEDDAKVPNVMADFIGDNVNDVAGNCSDLLESYVATIAASLIIASTAYFNAVKGGIVVPDSTYNATIWYPLVLAGSGLIACLISCIIASVRKLGNNPGKELDICTYIAAGLTLLAGLGGAYFLFGNTQLYADFSCGWASPFLSTVLGIVSGVAVGKITEYYTSTDYKPTRRLSYFATEGSAFVVTKGDALGNRSCLPPILVIAISMLVSYKLCGEYGIAISALGMLSFVGVTVAVDAFGPIADNAGGLAESCHLPHAVRVITDKLDACGNTTAAIGKGFAIGSAAYATVSLITAFVGNYSSTGGVAILNIAAPAVMAGAIIGGGLIYFFSGLLTDNTIDSAQKMADEGDRQLSVPGVLEGKVKPEYNKLIDMAAKEALHKMIVPSIFSVCVPIVGGFLFGLPFVGGILVGSTIVAIGSAIFNGNSGGAFDNGKKIVESGEIAEILYDKLSDAQKREYAQRAFGDKFDPTNELGIKEGILAELIKDYGKGTATHKAAVTGDTVGDTRKDVVGPALDIVIKTMSTTANTLAPMIGNFTLF